MKRSRSICLAGCLAALAALSEAVPTNAFPRPQTLANAPVPVVKGGAGPCDAEFLVKDASGKGIYYAKIEIQIKYGFMALHRLDAMIGTNFEGKARIEGLPDRIKGSAEFAVSQGDLSKSLPFDPLDNCHPRLDVVLGAK